LLLLSGNESLPFLGVVDGLLKLGMFVSIETLAIVVGVRLRALLLEVNEHVTKEKHLIETV